METEQQYCLGCGYPLCHLTSGRCPECGLAFDFDDPKSYVASPFGRHLRRWVCSPPGLGSHLFGVALLAVTLVYQASGDRSVFWASVCLAGWGGLVVSWIVQLMTAVMARAYRYGSCRNKMLGKGRYWFVLPGLLVVLFLAMAFHVPFYGRLWLSLPAMNRFADGVAGTVPGTTVPDQQIGFYAAYDIEVDAKQVRFRVKDYGSRVSFIRVQEEGLLSQLDDPSWISYLSVADGWYLSLTSVLFHIK